MVPLPLSYIGVTGFTSRNEVLNVMDAVAMPQGYRLMVGVHASLTTLRAEEGNEEPSLYPQREDIRNIFPKDDRILNVVHFTARRWSGVSYSLHLATVYGGKNCQGVQINIPWPDVEEIRQFRHEKPKIVIILQVGTVALRQIHNNPQELVRKVATYNGCIDGILLDTSNGTGVCFQPKTARAYVQALKESGLSARFSIGLAGGLGSTSLQHLREVSDLLPHLSLNAQSKLRDQAGNLDLVKVEQYLREVCRLVQEHMPT